MLTSAWRYRTPAGRREAIEQFHVALSIDPDFAGPHFGRPFVLADKGDLTGAILELREVVRFRPESPDPPNDLRVMLTRNAQFDSAIVEHKKALRLNPNLELTLKNLAAACLCIAT